MSQSRQLSAIMFTDIVGYTALMGNDEQRAFEFLNKNRQFQKPIIEQWKGRWIKELGDGIMATFTSVSDAVNAAIKIQEACNAAKDFQLRIGIHLGEVVFENDDVFGDGVNIASRIQSAAKPGSIYVSESVHQNVSNKKDIQTQFIREEMLRNVKDPVRMYEVIIADTVLTVAEKPETGLTKNSIAVLPFINMSNDAGQEYFSDGISEEIINRLAQVPGLKVMARTSCFAFKGKNLDLKLIGGQLKVGNILEGSVRSSGNKLRITAQLISVADGFHLYSETFDRVLEDIFEIQDEISLAILNAIKIKLVDADSEAVLKRYTDNVEAYNLYLKGRYYYNKLYPDEIKKAIQYFEGAIKIDPGYAIAFAGLSFCYNNLWAFNYLPPEQCLPQMIQSARQALQLDNEIAESHLDMGRVKLWYEWDFAGASVEYEKAIAINPNNPECHVQLAFCNVFLNNYSSYTTHLNTAYSLDPFSLLNIYFIGAIYWMAGDFEKVLKFGKMSNELEPNFFAGHQDVGLALMGLNRRDEAITEFELAVTLNNSILTLHTLGWAYGMNGEKDKARQVLEKMQALAGSETGGNVFFGIVYAALGEFDRAFQYFDKAIEEHEAHMLFLKYWFRNCEEFNKHPGTKQMYEKIGLPL
jgi:TolB-like protein/class 3 adenylate cyclase/Tfp pilus assembly protein PilF